MNPPIEQMTEALSICDKVDQTTATTSQTINSTGVDMRKFYRVMYVVQAGAGGSPTVCLQSAAASSFATPHTISGTVTTPTTSGGITSLETSAEMVEQQNRGDRYVRLHFINSGTDTLAGAICYGHGGPQKPAKNNDITTLQRLVAG